MLEKKKKKKCQVGPHLLLHRVPRSGNRSLFDVDRDLCKRDYLMLNAFRSVKSQFNNVHSCVSGGTLFLGHSSDTAWYRGPGWQEACDELGRKHYPL